MKRVISVIISTMLLLIMVMPTTAFATETSSADVATAVSDARTGVLQVEMMYEDDDYSLYSTGSSFLIGETSGAEYLITSAHVVIPEVDDYDQDDVTLRVVVKRDVYIGAQLVNYSTEMDFAILKLDQPIYDRAPLVLNNGDDNATATQTVYALGFPLIGTATQDVQLYTSDDVTVTTGIVSKKNQTDGVSTIHHSAGLDYGNSGGPLLNAAGQVIGINKAVVTGSDLTEDNISIDITEVTTVLDMLGITYTSSTAPVVIDEGGSSADEGGNDIEVVETVDMSSLNAAISAAEAIETDDYTEETVETFEDALEDAKAVSANAEATQDQVNAASSSLTSAQEDLEEAPELNMVLIGGIAAAVVVLLIIIILVVVLSSSKKKKRAQMSAAPMQGRPTPVAPAPAPVAPTPVAPAPRPAPTPTPVGSEGDNPTTLLNSGAGETGVLGGSMIHATLIRVKNNETITISKQMFKLGKERAKVDYCIADNNSVSRVHAHIMARNGEFFVIDQNATNFTFVNGTKAAPSQEVKLNTGDKIKLSDEEFEFRI